MEIFLIKALQLILCFALLIVLHEAGHFLFAKLFKVRVEKFCLFFDPWKSWKLFSWRGTDYHIGWIPLGGYVKISGMIDESMDTEQMKQPVKPWEFRAKPAWQRLLIMVGGVMVNFLLAFFIYAMVLFAWGDTYTPIERMSQGFKFNESAQSLGFRDGDIPLRADGQRFTRFSANLFRDLSQARSATVLRQGKEATIALPGNLNLLEMLQAQPPFAAPLSASSTASSAVAPPRKQAYAAATICSPSAATASPRGTNTTSISPTSSRPSKPTAPWATLQKRKRSSASQSSFSTPTPHVPTP